MNKIILVLLITVCLAGIALAGGGIIKGGGANRLPPINTGSVSLQLSDVKQTTFDAMLNKYAPGDSDLALSKFLSEHLEADLKRDAKTEWDAQYVRINDLGLDNLNKADLILKYIGTNYTSIVVKQGNRTIIAYGW